jgi:hypothetical protein
MNVKNRQLIIVGLNFTNALSSNFPIKLPFTPHSVIVRQCSWHSGANPDQGHAVIYSNIVDYNPQLCIIRDYFTDAPNIEHTVNKSAIAHGYANFTAYITTGGNDFIPSSPTNVALLGTCLLSLEFIEYDKK